MLLSVIRAGGKATKKQIASDFLLRDVEQIEYYRRKVVHPMPGNRLVRDGLLEKENDTYRLSGVFSSLNAKQLGEVEKILEDRISAYMDMRNPYTVWVFFLTYDNTTP